MQGRGLVSQLARMGPRFDKVSKGGGGPVTGDTFD